MNTNKQPLNPDECLTSLVIKSKLHISIRRQQYWDRIGLVDSIKLGGKRIRFYKFRDVIQLTIIKKLRDEGVSLQTIRRAVERLRKDRELKENVLVGLSIATDGNSIFIKESGKVRNAVTGQLELFPFEIIFQETKIIFKTTNTLIAFPLNLNKLKIMDIFPEQREFQKLI